jgi:transposase
LVQDFPRNTESKFPLLISRRSLNDRFSRLILPRSSGHSAKRVISKTEVKNETKKESTTSVVRNKYTAPFKEQALERADRDGIPKVAQDLGVAESMLYSWRSKRRQTGQSFEE